MYLIFALCFLSIYSIKYRELSQPVFAGYTKQRVQVVKKKQKQSWTEKNKQHQEEGGWRDRGMCANGELEGCGEL